MMNGRPHSSGMRLGKSRYNASGDICFMAAKPGVSRPAADFSECYAVSEDARVP